jgi:hypothetical protein
MAIYLENHEKVVDAFITKIKMNHQKELSIYVPEYQIT